MTDSDKAADEWIRSLQYPDDLHCDDCGRRGFVAGWHARDEEIEQLRAAIHDYLESPPDAINRMKKLRHALQRLSNPHDMLHDEIGEFAQQALEDSDE